MNKNQVLSSFMILDNHKYIYIFMKLGKFYDTTTFVKKVRRKCKCSIEKKISEKIFMLAAQFSYSISTIYI